jgi:hypothetical protein
VSSSPLVLYCFNSGSVRLLAIASMFIRGKSSNASPTAPAIAFGERTMHIDGSCQWDAEERSAIAVIFLIKL